jgi:thioredoxin reductase
MDDDEKSKIGLAKAQSTQIYATIGIINEDAFREGVVNQLIEDGTYPGLDDAIEEYGSEPEEPEDTGGYVPGQPGGQPGGGAAPPPKTAKPAVGAKLGDYDPDEPRDPRGKWTAGGGGGGAAAEGAHPGHGYSKGAHVVNGVIHTTDVNDAVRALYEGRKVFLNQPREVATLLGKLADVAKEMEKLGAKKKNFNLCDASVEGTNLFCAESKGIKRVKMPQISDPKAFQDYLKKQGVKFENVDEYADHLRATQNELKGAQVGGIMKAMREGKVKEDRIMVSHDNYVLDGHHRWAATVGIDSENNKLGDIKMPVARADIGIIALYLQAEKFTGGAGHKGVSDRRPWHWFDYSPDQPRGVSVPGTTPGSFAPSSGGAGAGTSEATAEEGYKTGLSKMRRRWAYLDKQLFQYNDMDPKDSLVKKLVTEQISLSAQIHTLQMERSTTERQGDPVRDVVVVGAGPAGIQAGIYGGSEGLNTLVVEASSEAGGQAGASSRIENLMGFPTGVSGAKLAKDGVEQAQRLGAEIRLNRQVAGLIYNPETGLKTLKFADGSTLESKAVIIAGGVQFNQVKIPGSDSPDVVYGSSSKLKKRVGDGDAIIVGGANSAGQAAMDTAISSRHVTLLARSGLGAMSNYLKDQIEAHPRITVKHDEIIEIRKDDDGRMTGAVLKDGTILPAKGVLYAIGSLPFTNWVSSSAIERDEKGFIKTGGVGREHLETNIPGVFAAGDVRSGSVKRVVTAGADGAAAISMVHGYLEKMPKPRKAA